MSIRRATKVCVVCHEDCSGRPRTKDSKGNYYCTPCYEQRLEDVRQGKAQSLLPPVLDEAPPQLDDEIFALDPNLIAQESAASGPSPGATAACPSCGMGVQPGNIICMNCGCNLQTGQALRTKIKKDHSATTSAATQLLLSPMAVGIAAAAIVGIAYLFALQSDAGLMGFFVTVGVLGLVAGLWALVAGFMEGVGYGLATLCVPFFVLYTVYGLNENPYLKWLYSVMLLSYIPYFTLMHRFDALVQANPGF